MTRSREIRRPRSWINSHLNRHRTVGGRNPGGHAAPRFDRDAKSGASRCRVVGFRYLQRYLQLIQPLLGERKTDQTTAVPSHEVYDLRRDFFSRTRQITFVFAVFIVDDDDYAPGSEFFDRLLNSCKCHVPCSTQMQSTLRNSNSSNTLAL